MGFLKEARPIAKPLPTHDSTRLTNHLHCYILNRVLPTAKYSPTVFKFMRGVNKDRCAMRVYTTELFLAIRKYEVTQQLRMKR